MQKPPSAQHERTHESFDWAVTPFGPQQNWSPQLRELLDRALELAEKPQSDPSPILGEEHYRTLFQSIDEGVCTFELIDDTHGEAVDYRFLEVNPAFEKQTGLVGAAGKTIRELAPNSSRHWVDIYAKIRDTGQSRRFEMRAELAEKWFEVHAFPCAGNMLAAIFIDITWRKRRETMRSLLAELTDQLASSSQTSESLAHVAARLGGYLHTRACILSEYTDDGQMHLLHFWPDNGSSYLKTYATLEDMFDAGQVELLNKGEPLIISDTNWPVAQRNFERAWPGARSALVEPLARKGKCIFHIMFIDDKPRHWRNEEIDLAREIANRVWNHLERSRAESSLRAAHDSFRHLVEHSPFGVYAVDADFRLVQVSDGAQNVFSGVRPLLGRDFCEVLHIIWPEPFAIQAEERFRHTLQTGEPYRSMITSERRADIGITETYDWKIERVTLPDGRYGVVCHFYDLSERHRHEQHIRLLMREINHRSKNMLTLVQAIARQTASTGVDDFIPRFNERVQALSVGQDLLIRHDWKAVPLEDLLHSQLSHFADLVGDRIEIDGPPLQIKPSAAQALGMAMHELATNAAKYGALSNPSGRINVAWTIDSEKSPTNEPGRFKMSWTERGGPLVKAPTRRGFGSIVSSAMVQAGLGGKVDADYAPSGLVWTFACPLANLSADDLAQPEGEEETHSLPLARTVKRVLVVEDEPIIAAEITSVLERAGFSIVGPASNVRQALSLMEKAGCDAAVLDVNLGTETSEDVARALQSRATPFIVVSGTSRGQMPPILRAAPLVGKPLPAAELEDAIRRCFPDGTIRQ